MDTPTAGAGAFSRFLADPGEKQDLQKIETVIITNPYYVLTSFLSVSDLLSH
jgi:hypothetical protein